jgi:hypothetical protein
MVTEWPETFTSNSDPEPTRRPEVIVIGPNVFMLPPWIGDGR